MAVQLPRHAGQLVRTTVRAPDGMMQERWRAPVQTVAPEARTPCCGCAHFRFAAGQALLRKLGGRGALNEAGVLKATPNADKIGLCYLDGSLCDPLATCRRFKLASGWSCVEAAVAKFMGA